MRNKTLLHQGFNGFHVPVVVLPLSFVDSWIHQLHPYGQKQIVVMQENIRIYTKLFEIYSSDLKHTLPGMGWDKH